MIEHKILFSGTMGAGKTTAIAAVSEIGPLSTDVRNTDESVAKATTTVGLDYGELTLDNGERLRLYGTPGQPRFAFMWDILARGALGLVILIDNSRPDPLADLDVYLDGYASTESDYRAESGPPGDFDADSFGSSNVYFSGAFLWHALRKQLGDDVFFEAVKGWPQSQDNRSTDRETLLAYLEEQTGEDLDETWDAWLLGETSPELP